MIYAIQQWARLCNDPKYNQEQAMKIILRCIIGTIRHDSIRNEATRGVIFKPDKIRSIDNYEYTSFAGEWKMEWSNEPT